MQMGRGEAFAIGTETNTVPVLKQWSLIEGGRTVLVEQVPFTAILPQLQTLPGVTASLQSSPGGLAHQAANHRVLPERKLIKKSTGGLAIAASEPSSKGVVLDYSILTSQTNYTFVSDMTYYVSGTVNLSGTNTTFEGGTVLKFTNGASLNISGPLTWKGSSYRPVTLVASDDSTVGERIGTNVTWRKCTCTVWL